MLASSLYNNVKPFPENGNLVGVDKLVFDLPYSDELEQKLQFNKVLNLVEDTGEIKYRKGSLECGFNIEVMVYRNYIRFILNPVIELYGSNFYTISRKEFRYYLHKLAISLGINISEGIIRRIDFQATLKILLNATSYFEILGSHRYLFKSNILGSTLYYNSKSKKKYKTQILYDKSKKEGKNTPLYFKGGNYLRVESQYYNRFIKKIATKLGKVDILIEDLFEDEVYNGFVECWYKDYKDINKEYKTMFNPDNINKPSDIDKLLASEGIKYIGSVEEVCKMIDTGFLIKDKSSSFRSKVKGRIKDIASSKNVIIETPLLEELENKIKDAYQNTLISASIDSKYLNV